MTTMVSCSEQFTAIHRRARDCWRGEQLPVEEPSSKLVASMLVVVQIAGVMRVPTASSRLSHSKMFDVCAWEEATTTTNPK
jgi:hypothetical protein